VGHRFDAVLLGWGSLSHVLSPAHRALVLQALDRLCPEGPLLVSFLPRSFGEGRAGRLGRRLGSTLFGGGLEAPLMMEPWFGFAAPLEWDELDALARALGRCLRVEEDATSYPHATLYRGTSSNTVPSSDSR
jgi:hypothetical protein